MKGLPAARQTLGISSWNWKGVHIHAFQPFCACAAGSNDDLEEEVLKKEGKLPAAPQAYGSAPSPPASPSMFTHSSVRPRRPGSNKTDDGPGLSPYPDFHQVRTRSAVLLCARSPSHMPGRPRPYPSPDYGSAALQHLSSARTCILSRMHAQCTIPCGPPACLCRCART